MSASNQKKIRKEKAAAYMSERQRVEAKEQKKLKIYTATFWIVLALCVSIVLGTLLVKPVKDLVYSNTNAVTVGSHTLSAVEVNYFYVDAINQYVSQYSSYISYILDTKTPLNQQWADQTNLITWADKFLDMAFENMKSTYAMYDLAKAEGFTLTEDQQASVDSMMSQLKLYASYYGYSNANDYLVATYGNGASEKSYKAYYETAMLADAYYAHYSDSLEFVDGDLRAYEADKKVEYNSYTYATYYVNATKYREGGTKDDKGNITYTEEEKKAAIEAAKKDADALAAGTYADLEAFDAAIKALKINENVEKVESTKYDDVLYSSINSLFRDWLIGKVTEDEKDDATTEEKPEETPEEGGETTEGTPEGQAEEDDKEEVTYETRKEGDMTVIVSESTSGETKTINGYYVVRFQKVEDNTFNLKNVRHILVKFEGGTYNQSTGKTTYTDAEKKAAKAKAEAILAEFNNSDKTEDSFATLATQKSEDTGSNGNGGLYEDVYPGQMVEAFNDWCFDEARKTADTGIVETEYGYHVMYYVGESETNYRDYMITEDLRAEKVEEWHKKLIEGITLSELNLKYVDMDMILG